jgi:oxygen-dependent protoporphyrinogen oxidase
VRIAIVGAGLAGLVLGLRRGRLGDDVTLFDAAPRPGGQIWSERVDGYVVEHGAEGYVARSEAVQALATELGIEGRVREQLTQRSFGFDGSSLKELGPGEAARFLGFQVARDELGRGIRSFAGGMQDLTDALVSSLPGNVTLSLSRGVESVSHDGDGCLVTCSDGARLRADRVVVATSAAGAARVLTAAYGVTASTLATAPTSSSVTVSLGLSREHVAHALDGTGFVVAEDAQHEGFRACTFVSSKFAERAPNNAALLRLFFRTNAEEIATLSDSAFAIRAERRLHAVIGLTGAVERAWVSRWSNALPVHSERHRAAVAALEVTLAGTGVFLTGSAFHGSGIDAAVRSAERIAAALT